MMKMFGGESTSRALLSSILCLLLAAHCLPAAFSQSATATLSGTVVDQTGAVVPGASISVVDAARGLKRQATTNDEGYFIIPLLPPSTYSVTIERQGFASAQVKDVVLNVTDHVALKIELQVGQVGESVDVRGGAPLINESPAVSTVVN
ncbi:MAG TPA: carboxypeptidase-like regulatory domain-containing protein, partial [Blastocatellia bacterium]|nr:carboxypeptidase-like regulatory domain-containing protein [Blastocatellia bacterium]